MKKFHNYGFLENQEEVNYENINNNTGALVEDLLTLRRRISTQEHRVQRLTSLVKISLVIVLIASALRFVK